MSSDDWAMYDCLKSAAYGKGPENGTASLKDFFCNVHNKVTQNVTEKHLLGQQLQDLKTGLASKER